MKRFDYFVFSVTVSYVFTLREGKLMVWSKV